MQQTDFTGTIVNGQAVVAGMLVRKNAAGEIVKAGAAASANPTDAVNSSLYGFAYRSQTDFDVVESNKLGAYALDGSSVIETDQTTVTINNTNFPIGSFVVPDATATGLVRPYVANGKVIGTVEGIRSIQGTTVLAIKLAA